MVKCLKEVGHLTSHLVILKGTLVGDLKSVILKKLFLYASKKQTIYLSEVEKTYSCQKDNLMQSCPRTFIYLCVANFKVLISKFDLDVNSNVIIKFT